MTTDATEKKITVAVLFGGRSPEHDISKLSAKAVIANMRAERYDVLPVFITKAGEWLLYDGPADNILTGRFEQYAAKAVLSPDTAHRGLLRIVGERVKVIAVDAAFSVLHGAYGEDGAIQGLFELAGIPYVGCGVLASALSMDKRYTKKIVDGLGIRQAKHYAVHDTELAQADAAAEKVESALAYPIFVKPSQTGSSVGVSRVLNRQELIGALRDAAQFDSVILAEEEIKGRELECAVLGNTDAEASPVGEILPADEFYSFEAKYHNKNSKTIVPAVLSPEKSMEIREKAVRIFKALGCRGLARVDFFMENDTQAIVFNEINTMPGFTSISMYPMLWQEAGLDFPALIDKLITLAGADHSESELRPDTKLLAHASGAGRSASKLRSDTELLAHASGVDQDG